MRIPPVLALFGLALALSASAIAQDSARIAGFQAYLFNSRTGELSADMLAKTAPEMGNVPSGKFASVSTLVVVRIEFGKHASIPDRAQVRLIATESGSMPFAANRTKIRSRVILDHTSRLGPVSAEGTTHVGFWLADTGCRSIGLKASMVGVSNAASSTSVLPFACYE